MAEKKDKRRTFALRVLTGGKEESKEMKKRRDEANKKFRSKRNLQLFMKKGK
jgi:hypothetical protein